MKKLFHNVWELLQSKRFKSFYWRMGAMAVAGLIDLTLADISTLEMPPTVTVVVGLVLGEISKALNKKYLLKK